MNKNKILSLQYLRAITIFIIVFWHVVLLAKIPDVKWYNGTVKILLSDGTGMFVFISGYFFQLLSLKYTTYKFYITKFNNIVIPYIVISIISILLLDDYGWFHNNQLMSMIAFPINGPLWFIPLIIIIFSCYPLLLFLSKKNLFLPALFSFFLVIISFRGNFTYSPHSFIIGNLIHFVPCFIIGMWYRQNQQIINNYIENNIKNVILFFILFSMVFIFKQFNNVKYINFIPTLTPYRLFSVILFIYLFDKIKITGFFSKLLSCVGDMSFSIFFIHEIINEYFLSKNETTSFFIRELNPLNKLIFCFFMSIAVVATCCLIAILFKFFFKKYSKLIIGY